MRSKVKSKPMQTGKAGVFPVGVDILMDNADASKRLAKSLGHVLGN